MLERVKAEIRELGGFRMAEYAEDATVIVEVVVKDAMRFHAVFRRVNQSALYSSKRRQTRLSASGNTRMTALSPLTQTASTAEFAIRQPSRPKGPVLFTNRARKRNTIPTTNHNPNPFISSRNSESDHLELNNATLSS